MQVLHKPEIIFICDDCHFIDTSDSGIDKCPICKNDEWVVYPKQED